MAKIKFTAIVAEMRNSIAGTTFSKNRYGNYARTKVTPVNPQTTYQQDQRQLLASLSSSWRGLTQAQRDQWTAQAQNYPRTDIFGDSKILSGQALYVALNINLERAGETRIDAPLSPVDSPQLAVTAMTAIYDISDDNMLVTVTISPAAIPGGYALVIYATPGVSAGKSFVKNLYRYLGTFTVTTGVATLGTAYGLRFGNVAVGDNIFLRAALVSTDTGQLGIPVEISETVASQA